ncbi:MAG: hypothetical protein EPO00_08500 [Chloroflexota bacterium]|nr:MAG: hypothetical protein EPO00_08500 [Chloroflexota bacterium]
MSCTFGRLHLGGLPSRVFGASVLVLAITGCGAPEPAPAAVSTFPPDVKPVWTVNGDTTDRHLNDATYFDHPGAPTLAAGAMFVAWSCSGSGRLEISPSRVQGHGGARPTASQRTVTFQVACPTDPDPTIYSWEAVPGLALGGENVLVVAPAISPSGPIRYTVVIAQASPP